MNKPASPVAVVAAEVAPRARPSAYPAPFMPRVAGREKRQLGDVFGLKNFGVNLTRLAPKAQSALRHAHEKQDEFVYILEGNPTLVTDEGRTTGPAARQRRTFTNWRRIGSLIFDNAVVSYNGDSVIHFNHPTWRRDRNDPTTATRIDGRKVR